MLEPHDHRAIGQRLDLFHLQEEAPGSVFWHPRGWALFRLLEDFIRRSVLSHGYQEVRSPQLLARSIWERSGHWDNFRENMFLVDEEGAIKPVNCPGHIQIFDSGVRSWRELPLRLAEFGICHRHEPRGALQGLMRLRSFVQDDAHIFCAEEQVQEEVNRVHAQLRSVYEACGLKDISVRLSMRPQLRAGSDAVWDRAEAWLAEAARNAGLEYARVPGEGAFYGPKLEFVLQDRRGRAWQCGTLQLDLVLPERFNIHYVAADGSRKRPVMLHRAVVGSLERFLAILLEHHDGMLPLWLAPEQVVIASVGELCVSYARQVLEQARMHGVRAVLDDRGESLGRKVLDAHQRGIPLVWIVGKREVDASAVSIRFPDGKNERMPVERAIDAVRMEQPLLLKH